MSNPAQQIPPSPPAIKKLNKPELLELALQLARDLTFEKITNNSLREDAEKSEEYCQELQDDASNFEEELERLIAKETALTTENTNLSNQLEILKKTNKLLTSNMGKRNAIISEYRDIILEAIG